MGTAVAQWLRCCATNRKVAGSIPDGVIGIFHWHNPPDRFYGPGVDSASNRNEYQENFLGVNAAGAHGWKPYHLPVPLSWNLGTLTSWNTLGHSRPVTGLICRRPATSSVHYTTSCNTQSSASEDGQNNFPKHVELTGIINKPLLLYLVGCLYYLYQCRTVKQISYNEIYLLIKYIKKRYLDSSETPVLYRGSAVSKG